MNARRRTNRSAAAPAEQQEAGEGERLGAHHPLQPLRRESEFVLDRGQGDGDDRGVENDHEERAAEKREGAPAAGVGPARFGAAVWLMSSLEVANSTALLHTRSTVLRGYADALADNRAVIREEWSGRAWASSGTASTMSDLPFYHACYGCRRSERVRFASWRLPHPFVTQ